MAHFLTKKFNVFGLKNVIYYKCSNCGFVISKTHYEMDRDKWEDLNKEYHYQLPKGRDNPWHRLTRLRNAAKAIAELHKAGLIENNLSWLDYGAGDGKLSQYLLKHKLKMDNFDKYEYDQRVDKKKLNYISSKDLNLSKFDFVISTAVFEHVLDNESLEEINSLVSDKGCMGIHTFVAKNIPADQNWFYFLPVHSAFYTNKSMQILMDRWGYVLSIYNLPSKTWFWFKQYNKKIKKKLIKINKIKKNKEYFFKMGFMDYWQ